MEGYLETADVLVEAGRNASVPTGMAFVDQAAARIALARGDAGLARSLAQDAIESLSRVDCALDELRTRVLLARALLATGERDGAAIQLHHVVTRADEFRAALVSREARAAAVELGIPPDERGPNAAAEATRPEEIPTTGERLVTVMFADVRGYTA